MARVTKAQAAFIFIGCILFLLPLFIHNQYVIHLGIMTFLFITNAALFSLKV
jgi:hypothetical protein